MIYTIGNVGSKRKKGSFITFTKHLLSIGLVYEKYVLYTLRYTINSMNGIFNDINRTKYIERLH